MSTVISALLTTEDLLALPHDGVERWLIKGELRESGDPRGEPLTVRNPIHSRVMTRVSRFLDEWNDQQPEPRGEVMCGEVGVRLQRNPDSTVGVDVVYLSPELAARRDKASKVVDGVPVLAVEILSPSDTQENISEKAQAYLDAGVRVVWVINPNFDLVTVLQSGSDSISYGRDEVLDGGVHLPGFSAPVSKLLGLR